MNYRINDVLEELPFNEYQDIFNAVKMGKANMKMNASDAMKIADINHPYVTNLLFFLPILLSIIPVIWYCITVESWWMLLILPINFILSLFIRFMPKIHYLAYIILALGFFIAIPLQFIVIAICLIIIHFSYEFWWGITYTNAFSEMQNNQEVFLWAWNRFGISIIDNVGNTYHKKFDYERNNEE